MALTYTATVVTDRATLVVEDTLQLSQAVGIVLIPGDVLHLYHLFIGERPAGALSATCSTPLS